MSTPTNGHPVARDLHPAAPAFSDLEPARLGPMPPRIANPAADVPEATAVAELREEVAVARALIELQDDEALALARSKEERQADRRVAERIRAVQRRERQRTGIEQVRSARRSRTEDRWSARAGRARERVLNPNRRLAAAYRRYLGLSAVTGALIVGAVLWMSATVHHGLVGVDGTWLAYLVEPLASVLLVVSMIAQFTAVEHGETNPRWFLALDGALVAASLVLNIVPWGVRFGWDIGMTLSHALPPLLIGLAVIVQHRLNRLFSTLFQTLHTELGETGRLSKQTADVVVLVERTKRALAAGHLELYEDGLPSKESIRKRFGIGKERSGLTGDALELLQREHLF